MAIPSYPLSVPRDHYSGKDPRRHEKARRHNEVAKECEDYLNQKIRENPDEVQMYVYGDIAHDLNLSTEDVYAVLFAIDCGHNGLTVHKRMEAAN
jgi:hypothetical protein